MGILGRSQAYTFFGLAVALTLISVTVAVATLHGRVQDTQNTPPLVVRVALFAADQGTLEDRRDFIDRHLFPAVRTVPGYVGTFLGRDPKSGQLVSISFWRSDADLAAGEQAVGRAIQSLPPGTAPRPSNVARYTVEYRDLQRLVLK